MSLLRRLLVAPIRFYRRFLSPLKPPICRFHPTCSAYAIEAIEVHGPLRGAWLATKRLCRCHPYGGYGEDLVPPPKDAPAEPATPDGRRG